MVDVVVVVLLLQVIHREWKVPSSSINGLDAALFEGALAPEIPVAASDDAEGAARNRGLHRCC